MTQPRHSTRREMWATVFGVWLLFTPAAVASTLPTALPSPPQVYSLHTQQTQPIAQLLQALATAQVVYLAETHEQAADHQAQLEIVRSLHAQRPLIIGMEMFQRPFQWALNQYLAGQISEAELRQKTDWQNRWGYDWELYAPILRFAREHQIPVLALNTPSEVTRKVARTGLESLTFAERQWIPPKSQILAEPSAYRERLRQFYEEIHQGKGSSANFERFFLAQVLWDETMADTIARAVRRSPQSLVVVLAGQGHIVYGDGIPHRVNRRLQSWRQTPLKQLTVILNPPPELPPSPKVADYFWRSP